MWATRIKERLLRAPASLADAVTWLTDLQIIEQEYAAHESEVARIQGLKAVMVRHGMQDLIDTTASGFNYAEQQLAQAIIRIGLKK